MNGSASILKGNSRGISPWMSGRSESTRTEIPDLFSEQTGGVALILVIWVVIILMAIVGEFSYSMRTEINITKNFKEEEESYQLALAGIEQAKIEILSSKESTYIYLNDENILTFEGGEEVPARKGALGKGAFSYTIIDEESKININNASPPQLRQIFKNAGLEITEIDTLVDSIIDWRDINDLHMLNGAEEEYYQSLEKPYSCKDGPFDVIEELLLVKGVTPGIFNGSNNEEEKYEGIAKFFTAWGMNTINVNTASREVLEAVFGIQTAESIILQRQSGPITTPTVGGTTVTSSVFAITSTGVSVDGKIKRTVKTVVRKNREKLDVLYWSDNFIEQSA